MANVHIDGLEVLIEEVISKIGFVFHIRDDDVVHIVKGIILYFLGSILPTLIGDMHFYFLVPAINFEVTFRIHDGILIGERGEGRFEGFFSYSSLFIGSGFLLRFFRFDVFIQIGVKIIHGFLLSLRNISLTASVEQIIYELRTGGDGDFAVTVHFFHILGNDSGSIIPKKKIPKTVKESLNTVFGAVGFLMIFRHPVMDAVIFPLFAQFGDNIFSFAIFDSDLIYVGGRENKIKSNHVIPPSSYSYPTILCF